MSKSDSGFIRATAKMPDGTGIQLEDWSDKSPGTSYAYAVGAYPRALHESGRPFGPRKFETFRLTISFGSLNEAKKAFEKLYLGEASLLDYRDRFWNQERDAELLEV